jgi:hypothetical protein
MFIEVHRLAQFNPRGTDVSVILDLMIHDIDIILNLVNSNVKCISANGVAVMSDTPDIANVRIEFDNGCVANLTSSRISMKKMRKMRLFQKDAYIGIDFLEKKTEVIKLNTEDDKQVFTWSIIDWGNIDLTDRSEQKCQCGKKASLTNIIDNIQKYYCKTHSKKLDIVNVPPVISSNANAPSLAFLPYIAIVFSTSAKFIFSVLRNTGTTRPVGEETATDIST